MITIKKKCPACSDNVFFLKRRTFETSQGYITSHELMCRTCAKGIKEMLKKV